MTFRLIPIMPMDFSVMEQGFSSMRQQFMDDMKSMENEMSRFCREISTFHESLPAAEGGDEEGDEAKNNAIKLNNWLGEMNTPLVEEEGDTKKLKLKFDVSNFKPEEVNVKLADNKLMIHAKHQETTDDHKVHHEYHRQFILPRGVDASLINSALSKDGVLSIEAPLPPPVEIEEQDIPITIE